MIKDIIIHIVGANAPQGTFGFCEPQSARFDRPMESYIMAT